MVSKAPLDVTSVHFFDLASAWSLFHCSGAQITQTSRPQQEQRGPASGPLLVLSFLLGSGLQAGTGLSHHSGLSSNVTSPEKTHLITLSKLVILPTVQLLFITVPYSFPVLYLLLFLVFLLLPPLPRM